MYAGVMNSSPQGTFNVEVLVDNMSVPMFQRGDGRRFVVGVPGASYMLKVTNMTSARIEVIATVDGRHVLDNEEGDSHRNRGFVISSHASYMFRGWRTSSDQTREFVFADPGSSVAVRAAGTTANLGVIGFAVHRELRRHGSEYLSHVAVAAAAPAAYSGDFLSGGLERSAGLGTGMGREQHDPVGQTQFGRDGSGPEILAIGYDTEEALQEMGILRPSDPNPFPGNGKTGYSKFQ